MTSDRRRDRHKGIARLPYDRVVCRTVIKDESGELGRVVELGPETMAVADREEAGVVFGFREGSAARSIACAGAMIARAVQLAPQLPAFHVEGGDGI